MDPEVITNRSGAIRGGEDRAYARPSSVAINVRFRRERTFLKPIKADMMVRPILVFDEDQFPRPALF
jgi:hypothetical protein